MTSHYVTSPAAYPGAREYHVTCSSPGIGGGTVWETEWRENTASVKSYPSAASSMSRRLKDGTRRRPQEFDGTVSWEAYKTQFELLASARQWSCPEMAMQLVWALKGPALEVLNQLPAAQRCSYSEFRGKCYSCGQQGHTKRYCPQGSSSGKAVNGRAGQYQYKPCYWNCGQGHKTAECALVSQG
ncbi:hypothetical protein O3P69_001841 [Scylla paramamosain]|uniref:CCHC-type domain-containing protein n=1 Tax=Scylla paramamosain TaxID=85552 RepID=A0AAW0V0Q8_SCYPA